MTILENIHNLKKLKMDNLYIGKESKISKVFSAQDVESFASLSCDINPVHLDEEYAKQTFFRKRIVHGFLYGSLISAIIGSKMPGHGSIYMHQEMNFKRPVYINEKVTAKVIITEIKPEKSLVFLDTFCYNDKNEIVIEGKAIIKRI